jgi:hypothetical protein
MADKEEPREVADTSQGDRRPSFMLVDTYVSTS